MATDTRPGFRLPWGTGAEAPNDQSVMGVDVRRRGGSGANHDRDHPHACIVQRVRTVSGSRAVRRPRGRRGRGHAATGRDHTPVGPARNQVHGRAQPSHAGRRRERPDRDNGALRGRGQVRRRRDPVRAPTNEAAELRSKADGDVAAIRDWSKAEIARVREETESRIAARKAALDDEMVEHRRDHRGTDRTCRGGGRRVRSGIGRLLRAPECRRGSNPDRHDGRDHARAADPGRRRRLGGQRE